MSIRFTGKYSKCPDVIDRTVGKPFFSVVTTKFLVNIKNNDEILSVHGIKARARGPVASDNVRGAQCAICALKRKIAHYFVFKCANFASKPWFHNKCI